MKTRRGDPKKWGADWNLRKRFGIPCLLKGGPDGFAGIEEYERRLKEQGGVCAMCGRPPKLDKRLNVDHRHDKSKQIRGLLCSICNGRLLGRMERFKAHATLPQMIRYLQKFDPENILLRETNELGVQCKIKSK